eukprot:6835827-Alexandrium_andersonii.AAC.1
MSSVRPLPGRCTDATAAELSRYAAAGNFPTPTEAMTSCRMSASETPTTSAASSDSHTERERVGC